MKNIPILNFKTLPDGKAESTVSLLHQCLKIPPSGGFDFAVMRSRGRVADALDKAGTEISLEDSDYATAIEAIKATRWGVNEKYLIQFAEQFGL